MEKYVQMSRNKSMFEVVEILLSQPPVFFSSKTPSFDLAQEHVFPIHVAAQEGFCSSSRSRWIDHVETSWSNGCTMNHLEFWWEHGRPEFPLVGWWKKKSLFSLLTPGKWWCYQNDIIGRRPSKKAQKHSKHIIQRMSFPESCPVGGKCANSALIAAWKGYGFHWDHWGECLCQAQTVQIHPTSYVQDFKNTGLNYWWAGTVTSFRSTNRVLHIGDLHVSLFALCGVDYFPGKAWKFLYLCQLVSG